MEWNLVIGKDDCENLMCKAVKKTWTNQRRKRRLAAAQNQQTTSKKPKGSTDTDEDGCDEHKRDETPIVTQEIPIESCHFEFTCILNRTDANLVQFKWLHGDSKDNLHQITQYLKNQTHLHVQTKS